MKLLRPGLANVGGKASCQAGWLVASASLFSLSAPQLCSSEKRCYGCVLHREKLMACSCMHEASGGKKQRTPFHACKSLCQRTRRAPPESAGAVNLLVLSTTLDVLLLLGTVRIAICPDNAKAGYRHKANSTKQMPLSRAIDSCQVEANAAEAAGSADTSWCRRRSFLLQNFAGFA